jgi:hypothetical protein
VVPTEQGRRGLPERSKSAKKHEVKKQYAWLEPSKLVAPLCHINIYCAIVILLASNIFIRNTAAFLLRGMLRFWIFHPMPCRMTASILELRMSAGSVRSGLSYTSSLVRENLPRISRHRLSTPEDGIAMPTARSDQRNLSGFGFNCHSARHVLDDSKIHWCQTKTTQRRRPFSGAPASLPSTRASAQREPHISTRRNSDWKVWSFVESTVNFQAIAKCNLPQWNKILAR